MTIYKKPKSVFAMSDQEYADHIANQNALKAQQTSKREVSLATKIKLSNAMKGRPKPEGFGKNLSEKLRGIPKSEATKAKMSAAAQGRKISLETRAKMSIAQKARVRPPQNLPTERQIVSIERSLQPHAEPIEPEKIFKIFSKNLSMPFTITWRGPIKRPMRILVEHPETHQQMMFYQHITRGKSVYAPFRQ